MKKSKRFVSFLLAALLLLVSPPSVFAAGDHIAPETPPEKEALIAQAEELLQCENGEFPEELCLEEFCGALAEIDPELVERVYQHIEAVAYPAEIEEAPPANYALTSEEPHRHGVYVRDGDGGYYIYNDSPPQEETLPEEPSKEDTEGIEPYSSTDYNTVANPDNNRLTSTICKVVAKRGSYYAYSSGFFVSNFVVATAAHSIYANSWDGIGLGPHGWADEVYIYQAYVPGNAPYSRVYADNKQMRVGASWGKNDQYRDDDDWGVFVVKKTMQGGYSYLPKRQISAKTYTGKTITIYGYPRLENDPTDYPMFAIKGKTIAPPSGSTKYRTLYSTGTAGDDASNFSGVSGGPVVDTSGYVIGINVAKDSVGSPKLSRAIAFDSDLYKALKAYE